MSFFNTAAHLDSLSSVSSAELLPHFKFFGSSWLNLAFEDMQSIKRQSSDSTKSESMTSCHTSITESSVSSITSSPFHGHAGRSSSSHALDTPSPISAQTPASHDASSSSAYRQDTCLLRSSSEPAASPSNAYIEHMHHRDSSDGTSPRVNSTQSTPRDRLSHRRPPRLSIENGMTNFQLLSPPVPAKARVAGSMDLS